MTITDYELFSVPPRWTFLKLTTDDGEIGWGEPIVEGRSATVRRAVEELLETHLLGEDPTAIEDHWQTMYRGGFYRGGPVLMSAIAGIDQALWDLKGKQFGAPVYELLGGPVRDRVRIYQSVDGDSPDAVAEAAGELVDAGLTAVKLKPTGALRRIDTPEAVADAEARMSAVRDAVGPGVDVALDFHGRVAKPMAGRLAAALEPYDPMFIEEPILPEQNEALPDLARHTTVPVATGERMYSRWDFEPVLADGAVDVIQPDPSHAGGITEVHKIAAMAEAHDVALAPHCPLGPIAFAACLQIDAVAPNALVQERRLGGHYGETTDGLDYLTDPTVFDYVDGFVELPRGPGLGIDLDESTVRERAGEVDWRHPVWRHEDGSVAEW